MKPVLAFSLGNIKLGNTSNTLGNSYSTTAPLINTILTTSITLAGIVLIGLLIFGGITLIMNAGSGDAKKAAQGKAAVTNAAIGFIIIIFAFFIIRVVETITGLKILNPSF